MAEVGVALHSGRDGPTHSSACVKGRAVWWVGVGVHIIDAFISPQPSSCTRGQIPARRREKSAFSSHPPSSSNSDCVLHRARTSTLLF